MRRRIFWSIFLTALAAVLIVGLFTARSFYKSIDARAAEELRADAESAAATLPLLRNPEEYLNALPDSLRATLISADGQVLYDKHAPSDEMENHSARPEVQEALRSGRGESYRYSDTLTEKTHYYAVRLGDGRILRVAVTRSTVVGLVRRFTLPFFLTIALTALLALFLSRALARGITAPISRLNLAEPLENDAYDELTPLLLRLEDQNEALRSQLTELENRRRELTVITESMREGLLHIDKEGNVLSINHSAARIFAVDPAQCIGQNILLVSRSAELHSVVQAAQAGRNDEALLNISGRVYRLLSTPVTVAGEQKQAGMVVLLLDVTARQQAEQRRREFTANVSHELRTPLTSIAGYSEIMASGLAKPEDLRGFAQKIHSEARRLIALVNDIMELSKLDEKAALPPHEDVDLFALCEKILPRLESLAETRNVLIKLTGCHACVWGVPPLLDEMTFNLIENAVKYNKEGGSVLVNVAEGNKTATLTVQDTGIGIPPEHQDRVFERFYRVDKSHSRETAGTGLGLAIVKHAAAIHGASVELTSTPGSGSRFTVTFSKRLHDLA